MKQKIRTASLLLLIVLGTGLVLMACGTKSLADSSTGGSDPYGLNQALLKGQRKYTVPLGTDPLGNIIRLDNSLNSFPERITAAENELTTLHQQQAAAQIEVEKPFPQEEELAEKSARLAELNAQLDVDEKSHEPEQDEEEQEDTPRRPSVLAALEEKSDKPEPVKPFRSYYDKDGDAR